MGIRSGHKRVKERESMFGNTMYGFWDTDNTVVTLTKSAKDDFDPNIGQTADLRLSSDPYDILVTKVNVLGQLINLRIKDQWGDVTLTIPIKTLRLLNTKIFKFLQDIEKDGNNSGD